MTPAQRKVLNELKADDSIIICPADKGKAVVIEDRETYLSKMHSKKGEKTILRRLHKQLMDQLIAVGIEDFKDLETIYHNSDGFNGAFNKGV